MYACAFLARGGSALSVVLCRVGYLGDVLAKVNKVMDGLQVEAFFNLPKKKKKQKKKKKGGHW